MTIITSLIKGALTGLNASKKLWIIVIILGILNIILKKAYPKMRGYFGEKWIREELNKLPIIPEEFQPKFKIVANISPTKEEIEKNKRARSARLRVIERVK